ncbi:hypothetical protein [Pedobacter cryotolerans]|uniref:Nucleotidyltransferase DUF2204 n=1 Tax=Pedobacter cryotolerans TaxID=2571270 RepID=A0A4U1CCC4_9SPHI|nr:hypothetical protein [Pedobacter cryotolerans]TKC01460.1 hypothetical protein FA045_09500 [Pedobacter cryotolerans]
MDILLEDHKQLLLSLLANKVDFILIGGYAVIHYGYERTTSDMDIWLMPDNNNKERLIKALNEFGIIEEDLKILNTIDFSEVFVFSIGEQPNKIDFLTKVQGLNYETANAKKIFFPLKDKKVPIIQYHHLLQIKMIAGRTQDKADVEILQKINQFRENKW